MKPINAQGLAAALSLLLLLTVAWPVKHNWIKRRYDSFPLSHYPMFSQERNGKASMTYLVGVLPNGERHYLPYQLVGVGGMNQMRKSIAKRAKKDPNKLCRKVAKAVARSSKLASVQTVKVVQGEFQFNHFFAGDQTPDSSTILCSCTVPEAAVTMTRE